MKKKFSFAIILLTVVAFFSFIIYAHPGRTDENGGHWDRSNGTYHYHNGEYAGRSQTYSSPSRTYEPFTPPYTPEPRKTNYFQFFANFVFIYIPLGVLGFVLLYFLIINRMIFAIQRRLPKYKIHQYGDAIIEFYHNETEIRRIHGQIDKSIINHPFPKDVEIGADGLPKEKGSKNWGDIYTFYKTLSGKKLHKLYDCNCAVIPCHIYTYLPYCKVYHCSIYDLLCKTCCNDYKIPSFAWYNAYKKRLEWEKELEKLKDKRKDLFNTLSHCNKICNSPEVINSIFFNKGHQILLKSFNKDYIYILNSYFK